MSANTGAVFAGLGQDLVTGTARSGPVGTALPPTDATFFEASLDSALLDAGYIGEKGIAIQTGRSFTDIKDMDGNAVDSIQTDSNGTVATNFLELNQVTLGNVFGPNNVVKTNPGLSAGTRLAVAIALGEDLDPQSWVFRMKSGKKRAGLILPKGRITAQGDITFTASGAASIDATIKALPYYDSVLGKNVDMYLVLDDGAWAISLVPVIASVLPSGAAAGASVIIRGYRFTGVTGAAGVKFGATNATSYTVFDDNTIVAVVPAGSAGPTTVTVTNGSGASGAFAYTRGA